MSERPTIKQVVEFQKSRGIDAHVVWLDEVGFVLAHTDAERHGDPIGIEDCALHGWLEMQDESPVEEDGYYIATPHEPDAYSEPYGADPWEFENIDEVP